MRKNKQIAKQDAFTEFLLYTTPNGKVYEAAHEHAR